MKNARRALVGLALGALAAGCTPESTAPQAVSIFNSASISVDPFAFLGLVPCSNQPGAMQTYVATVTDQTDPSRPFTLPSSPPTPCSQSVYFQFVTAGDTYTADIDGYDLPPDQLVPVCSVAPPDADKHGGEAPYSGGKCGQGADCTFRGCTGTCNELSATGQLTGKLCNGTDKTCGICLYPSPAPGDRHMLLAYPPDPTMDVAVSPRWTTPATQPCGTGGNLDGGLGTAAIANTNVGLSGCGTLEDHGSNHPTSILIKPSSTLGTLACAPKATDDPPGTVQKFDVIPADASLPPKVNAACPTPSSPDETPAVYEQGIQPGVKYTFQINAYETGKTAPSQTASCQAFTKAGMQVTAVCDPLMPIKTP